MRRIIRIVLTLALALGSLAPAARADAGRGRHQKLYVVPRPAKIVIDGRLDDWDLSGQIWSYVVSETAEMQSAKLAMMYDADALYVSGVVRDPSPMMNRHDPDVDPEKAWDADVCQIFLTLDPALGYPVNLPGGQDGESACTLYLWYYTDRKEPNLAAFRAMGFSKPRRPDLGANGVLPRDKFEAAYARADDGGGYTFEYRLPWATLGVKQAPHANDILSGVVCVFWGTPDGLKTAGGAAWAYDVMGTAGFPWQSTACWGKLILSAQGAISKDLVEEGLPPEKPLPLTFEYDLPEDGQVSIQLFTDQGLLARTLVAQGDRRAGRNIERWDGLDVFGKPLAAGRYAWKGVSHKGLKTKFLFSLHNSGQPPYHTDDNTGSWGGDHGDPTAVCAAGDSMVLAWSMCEAGFGIIRTDLKGKKLWGSKHNAMDLAADGARLFVVGDNGYEGAASVKVFDLKDCRPLNWGNGRPALAPPPGGNATTDVATAVAVASNRVLVAWTARNLVAAYDAARGDLQETWEVPAPGRLAVTPEGAVLVLSENQIKRIANGKVATFVPADPSAIEPPPPVLDHPTALAVDSQGQAYVANAGKLQNVSVLDRAGKFLRSIGKEGGRPAVGRYDRNGLYQPGGIAVDRSGRLWVAETTDAPKRHSVWDTASGELVTEFFGASGYFGWAYMDPKHPDEMYCHNVLWRVDLDRATAQPWSTIWRPTAPNMIGQVNPNGYGGELRVVTARNGRQYAFGIGAFQSLLFLRDGDVFKPIAAGMELRRRGYAAIGPPYPVMADESKYPDGPYWWQDANHDQTVQEAEIAKADAPATSVFSWIDGDLTAWSRAGFLLKPVRIEPDGRPVYDFAKREKCPVPSAEHLWVDGQDNSIFALSMGGDPDLAHYAPDGKLLWGYRGGIAWHSAINLSPIKPGVMHGMTMPLGIAGDFTGAASYFGVAHLVTRDGLYVGMLFRDGRLGGGLGPDVLCSETVTGQFVKPDGTNRYFFLGGAADGRVTEVLGLDAVQRLPGGEYMHTEAQVKQAAAGLAEYQAALAQASRLDVVRGRAALATSKGISKIVDDTRRFTVRAAYDAQNLYVAYEVAAPAELVNDAADPKRVFRGGNCLDLQFAADPAADPSRRTPAPGDVRILVTRQPDAAAGAGRMRTLAVVYRPKVKGFAGEPIVFKSPTGQESFDVIESADRVALEYRKQPAGFEALVTIPLDLLGWTPKPGTEVRLDLGYLFGNATGTQVALRSYWKNNSFSANVVADVPNESRLEPHEWGTARVE